MTAIMSNQGKVRENVYIPPRGDLPLAKSDWE